MSAMENGIPLGALGLVLFAAVLHASWNALVKAGGDRLAMMVMVQGVGGLVAAIGLLFIPFPTMAAWPYIFGSVFVHTFYYVFLIRAYQQGDLSQVYPIARGSSPLMVAIVSAPLIGETLGPIGSAAVVVICLAIFSLAFGKGSNPIGQRRSVLYAFGTGVTIAIYTVIDGLGARAAGPGNVLSYIAMLGLCEAVPIFAIAWWRRGSALFPALRASLKTGVPGGVIAWLGYGLVIWAMTVAPMTYVSALRETSVIIAAWMGTRLLGEPFGRRRILASAVVVAGVIVLHSVGKA